jgi:RNA polymerase sigma factor (sigma-70 family)
MAQDDTDIGGRRGRFPTTRVSAVDGVQSGEPDVRARSLETLVAAYWKPVYKHVRLHWNRSNEDAKDLTQAFFTRAMEKDFFDGYDRQKGRFRTFLRTCLDRFLSNEDKSERRLKRGGGGKVLPLDFEAAEAELEAAPRQDPEQSFDAEWVRSLFGLAVEALRAECAARGKEIHFLLFERHDLDDSADGRPTYAALASEFGLKTTDVTNHLAFARAEFRRLLLATLRDLTAGDEEFRREARLLLGSDPERPE